MKNNNQEYPYVHNTLGNNMNYMNMIDIKNK